MSAGTGLHHSEYNQSREQNVEFLQIWVFPDREGVKPRYENAVISDLIRPNELCVIVSPYPGDGHGGLWIYQQAWFSWGELEAGTRAEYALKSPGSFGVYVFVIDGEVEVAGQSLSPRDGLGVSEMDRFEIHAKEKARVLLIEVPEA